MEFKYRIIMTRYDGGSVDITVNTSAMKVAILADLAITGHTIIGDTLIVRGPDIMSVKVLEIR